jgi:hypothetical protein
VIVLVVVLIVVDVDVVEVVGVIGIRFVVVVTGVAEVAEVAGVSAEEVAVIGVELKVELATVGHAPRVETSWPLVMRTQYIEPLAESVISIPFETAAGWVSRRGVWTFVVKIPMVAVI